jgi:hypothetical protein
MLDALGILYAYTFVGDSITAVVCVFMAVCLRVRVYVRNEMHCGKTRRLAQI